MIMRRLFVSQPMRGKTQEEIIEARDKAVKKLSLILDEEFEVVDSYFTGVYWLGKSLELLSKCDLALFIDDWWEYRGCQIEREVARAYGIEILEI